MREAAGTREVEEVESNVAMGTSDRVASRRSNRTTVPTAKVQETRKSFESEATEPKRNPADGSRTTTTKGGRTTGSSGGGNYVEAGKTMLQRALEAMESALEAMESAQNEMTQSRTAFNEQQTTLHNVIKELQDTVSRQHNTILQLQGEVKQLHGKLDTIASSPRTIRSAKSSPQASYAEVARSLPSSQPSNIRTLSTLGTTPSTAMDTLFCTIDTSRVPDDDKNKVQIAGIRRAIEQHVRTTENGEHWRCAAVIKEARNSDWIRVICRNEAEVQTVKAAAQKIEVPGIRILRDHYYPVRIDNANRTAVLDTDGNILAGAAEALGSENEVNIAKIAWLSRKDSGKAYGSMVVYLTKSNDAKKLLDERFFHLAGESAYTSELARRMGPIQCYNCQELGHKAFACQKAQVCGRCAESGHHHNNCLSGESKCALCGGPHESYSTNCRIRRLNNNE
jgi:Zinc knuckle